MGNPEKRELRRQFLARRAALSAPERRAADAEICRNIRRLACYRNASCVAIYATDGEEPDLFSLFGEKRFFLPRYRVAGKCYEMVEIHDPASELARGKFGLLEPLPELPAAESEFIAAELLFLTPAVACSRQGIRLGRGGGFYDRMLAAVRRPVVGVIYSCQWSENLPWELHDRKVDFVVTEKEIFEAREKQKTING